MPNIEAHHSAHSHERQVSTLAPHEAPKTLQPGIPSRLSPRKVPSGESPAPEPLSERALEAKKKLESLNLPNGVDSVSREEVERVLLDMGQEFMGLAVQKYQDMTLGLNTPETILGTIKNKIMKNAEIASDLSKDPIEYRGESLQNLHSAIAKGAELQAIEDDAVRIILYKIDPSRARWLLHKYRKDPDVIPPPTKQLIKTAQDYLLWEEYSERYGLEEVPNIWEKLLNMYGQGMEGFSGDPLSGQMRIDLKVVEHNNESAESFMVAQMKKAA